MNVVMTRARRKLLLLDDLSTLWSHMFILMVSYLNTCPKFEDHFK
jgi:hypothetical protein